MVDPNDKRTLPLRLFPVVAGLEVTEIVCDVPLFVTTSFGPVLSFRYPSGLWWRACGKSVWSVAAGGTATR
jgi:hypothetical protein